MSLVAYPELHSTNPEKAKGFYGELFGWTFEAAPMPGPTYWGIKGADGSNGGLMETTGPSHWLPYITVADVKASCAKAQKMGAKVLKPFTEIPNMGAFAVLTDPLGAEFALWQVTKA